METFIQIDIVCDSKVKTSYYLEAYIVNLIRKYLLVFFILVYITGFTDGQQSNNKPDSTQIYKDIEVFSKRSKFTKFMYRVIFKPVAPIFKKKVYKKLIQKPYSTFEGKIVRNINIITLDPFGFSAIDTTVGKQNFILRTGNKLHIKSKEIAILNLLLFKRNSPFNSALVKESERLIRIQNYVHDVSFFVVSAGTKPDSVDIFIRELDKWTIIPAASISHSGFKVEIIDKNIIGSGHEFQSIFARSFTNEVNFFNLNYSIPNIRNTYIKGILHYGFDGYQNLSRSIIFDRPFYSPLAKWAAGISIASQIRKDSMKFDNTEYVPLNLKYNTYDFWAGKAIHIFKSSDEEEYITNLIFTTRFLGIRYFEKPELIYDPLHIYSNENFYFTSFGISRRKYVQDKFIFKYGVVEDVPVGKVFEITGGFQKRNNTGRMYLGLRFSFGNYYEWGYLSSSLEYGTFFYSLHHEQGALTVGLNYFTGLIELGKWKFRQFIKPEVIFGINRFPYDSLTLKDGYGLDGFNSSALSGTNRILLTIQTQAYAPWNFLGFHFGPFFIYSIGLLGDANIGFKNSNVYSQIGIGVLIKNENLIFNTFQFSISFYPVIPGYGLDVFKLNSFRTTDLGFRDFEIGKPHITTYQ